MPKRLGKAKHKELKEKFWELDASKDNKLSFAEMKNLLLEGNPTFTDQELKALFITIDTNNNGTVDFDEFVEFLYGVPRTYKNAPEPVVEKFTQFSGKDMDYSEFAKFCQDCGILAANFKKEECAPMFARVVPRGKRKIDTKKGVDGFSQYDKLLCLVAEKKECEIEYLWELIAEGSVANHGTVPDHVRLHEVELGASRQGLEDNYDIGEPGDWEKLRPTYRKFQREGGGLNQREFAKLMEDSGIADEDRFLKADADIIFTKIGEHKLKWDVFQEALRLVALKKKQQLEDIMGQIADCQGPTITCTQADEVRLHDDKDTYTGIHA